MAKKIEWTAKAKADLRAIDQRTALKILNGLARFLATKEGDVKRMQSTGPAELRLRIGDYRVRFFDHGPSIEILAVKHRKDVYR